MKSTSTLSQVLFQVILCIGISLTGMGPGLAQDSDTMTLQWDSNLERDLAGYRVYQGKTSGHYGIPIDVGIINSYVPSNLDPRDTYYFAVTAYDRHGNESPPSVEVSYDWNTHFTSKDQTQSNQRFLFTEDFTTKTLKEWEVVDRGTVSAPSAWSAATGALVQSSNIHGGSGRKSSVRKPGTQLILKKGVTWADYAISLILRSQDDDGLGAVIRYRDSENYYRFSWNSSREYRRLVKVEDGVYTVLAQDYVPYVPDQTYHLEINAKGKNLTVHIDDKPVFSVQDDSHKTGTIGLYSWGNQGYWVDDIQIASR